MAGEVNFFGENGNKVPENAVIDEKGHCLATVPIFCFRGRNCFL